MQVLERPVDILGLDHACSRRDRAVTRLPNFRGTISAKAIAARIEALAREITAAFKDTEKLVVVGLLRGSFVFIADLVRELDLPVEVDFLEVSSYGNEMESSREVRILKDLRGEIHGRDVLVVEDIVDTGYTMQHVVNLLRSREAEAARDHRAARQALAPRGRFQGKLDGLRDPRRIRRGLRDRLRAAQPEPALYRQGGNRASGSRWSSRARDCGSRGSSWRNARHPPSSRSSRSTEVMTTWFSPSFCTASATRPGSNGSRSSGGPVATLQKVQPRVQTSPMIIIVACPCDQHSPALGHPASSQTVTSLCSRMMLVGLLVAFAHRRLDADPGWFPGLRIVGAVRLFGVALIGQFQVAHRCLGAVGLR
jgi:hypoxanthine phosphoribosyltransferase